jgi:PadR family transcriptional regulator AphA
MSIRHAILGFLSWRPFTGYELKKLFSDALSFHWSGNSNQVYGALIELHRGNFVSVDVQQQEKYPARKVYTITEKGRKELREWLLSEPELPSLRDIVLVRLAWADSLSDSELGELIQAYEKQLSDQAIMCRETQRRGSPSPGRNPREALIWWSVEERNISFYENELIWLNKLRADLVSRGQERRPL